MRVAEANCCLHALMTAVQDRPVVRCRAKTATKEANASLSISDLHCPVNAGLVYGKQCKLEDNQCRGNAYSALPEACSYQPLSCFEADSNEKKREASELQHEQVERSRELEKRELFCECDA